jgi:hypothetical protein
MIEQSKIENPKSKIVGDSVERTRTGGQGDQIDVRLEAEGASKTILG